jgi:hypothetical protein
MPSELRNYWPTGLTDLVIKAAFHADSRIAEAAWCKWQKECDFNDTPWSDVRIASLAHQRLGCARSANALQPRLNGLRRYIWSAVNLRLGAAIPLLRAFHKNDVEFMMIKGSVLLARNPRSAIDRFMTDVDVLVDHPNWEQAVCIAQHQGWSTGAKVTYDAAIHRIRQLSHAVALRRGRNGSVDLHNFSLKLNKQLGADRDLWNRATFGTLQNVSVRLPHPSDQLAITLGHCFLHSVMPSHDWIHDSRAAILTPGFDWTLVGDVIIEREIAVPAVAGLTYLVDQLEWQIPSAILTRLSRRVREPFVKELATLHKSYRAKKPAELTAIYRAECIRSRKRSLKVPCQLQQSDQARATQTVFRSLKPGEKVYLPIPEAGPQEYIDYNLVFEAKGFPPGSSTQAVLRCFDGMPLEFGRLLITHRRGRYKLSGRIDGTLKVARAIDKLWFTFAKKKAPPDAFLHGIFKASTRKESRMSLRRLTALFSER